MAKEAMLYEKLPENKVQCSLCGRRCIISEGASGFCLVRKVKKGKLHTLVYGKACSACVDPITKKPLSHFNPGSQVMSIATVGCNFRCRFCDNWVISQEKKIQGYDLPPGKIVEATKENSCQGISYTYTEPTVFFEYAYDTAVLAHKEGIFNTFVTNGYMTPEAVRLIAPVLDAATVDFKGGGALGFYKEFASVPSVEPIYESLKEMKKHHVHIEVTNLIIPKIGDSIEAIRELAMWIRDNLGRDTVLHLLRFHPNYHLTELASTPLEALERACDVSREVGLNYVYLGNVPGHRYENTYCPNCKELLIKRFSFAIVTWHLTEDLRCPACGQNITIRGKFYPGGVSYPNYVI